MTKPANPRDPLLVTARFLLMFTMGIMAILAAAALIAAPSIFLFKAAILTEFTVNKVPNEAIWALLIIVLLLACCAVMGFLFFRHLYRIVGTVGEGDPFIPANAKRLNSMGWIVVALNLVAIPLVSVLHWFESVTEKVHTDAGLDFTGILLALILFILARVFREGTRMREELEGTV